MIELTPAEIAAASGARLVSGEHEPVREARPARAVIDSRAVEPGDLFFGLAGERAAGGEFAREAIEAGAWGAVVTAPRPMRRTCPRPEPASSPPRTRWPALGGLAARWLVSLRAGGCRVVGITGSTGKTSTKDILLAMLDAVAGGRAHGNRENWNTEIGLPLTVLEAAQGVELMVLEMAMRGMGQIGELARIARPEVGLITNIGPVHLELVGTIERVARGEGGADRGDAGWRHCVVPAAEEALRPHLRPDVRTITFAQCARSRRPRALAQRGGRCGRRRARPLGGAARDGLRVEVAAGAERGRSSWASRRPTT